MKTSRAENDTQSYRTTADDCHLCRLLYMMRPYGMHADRQWFNERPFGKGYGVRQRYDALLGQNDVLTKRSAPSGSAEYLLFRAQIIPPALA